jgi:addiction module HigA family antidote
MIASFRHRGLKRLYEKGDRRRINPLQLEKIELILADLEITGTIDHLRQPGYRLHSLQGPKSMPMKFPPHPGKHVRVNCLEPLGLTVTVAARALGISRQALNNLVNEKAGISAEMAIRFEKMGWGTADGWLRLQMNYDLAQVRMKADSIAVHPIA